MGQRSLTLPDGRCYIRRVNVSTSSSPPSRSTPAHPPLKRRGGLGGLRWQLGASYMRVTLGAVLLLEIIVVLLFAQGVLYTNRTLHPLVAERLEPVVADLLANGLDARALQAYLERPIDVRSSGRPLLLLIPRPEQGFTVILDEEGNVWFDNRSQDPVADLPQDGSPPVEQPVTSSLPFAGNDRMLAERALATGEERTVQGMLRTAYARPIETTSGVVVGAVFFESSLLPVPWSLVNLAVGGLGVAAILVVLVSTVFGLYASRPLARRIENLAVAADAWSEGDFSRAVHDPSGDELGRLARRLDRMAMQLSDLLTARQALAGSRERTRIARELHDSVKQQVFAASMLLGAARRAAPDDAQAHVANAERLVEEAKQELEGLIHELRPVAVEGRPLDEALRNLASAFPKEQAPRITLDLSEHVTASPEVRTAAYRIAQEALANALRHARASNVTLHLSREGDVIVLRIEDDGRGFVSSSSEGRGVGLASMRARAVELGGRVEVRSAPSGGTRVEARLPVGEVPA